MDDISSMLTLKLSYYTSFQMFIFFIPDTRGADSHN